MKNLLYACVAAIATTSAATAVEVQLLDRAVLNDYQYSYGGISGGIGPAPTDGQNQLELDFTGAVSGEFPGGGSGGGDGSNVGLIADPTVAGQETFRITGEIEGFGAVGAGDYNYAAELQFQDNENTLGLALSNPANQVVFFFSPSDLNAVGPTAFDITVGAADLNGDRGDLTDLANLIAAGEIDNININFNAGQGTDFYGADADAGFRVRNVAVFQNQLATIPEPSALAGLALVGGLVATRRRRRSR